ncbi:hypothetical protein IWQ61_004968 [Dispira simplex]|nr:hypothetical protein IWQ61_004968 [Dispira simplex]
MITPTFDVTQNDDFVRVTIYVPHLRTQDIDLHAQDNQLRFFARPYFLRLTFPGPIVEDERSTANYDLGLGQLVLQLSKVNQGEHFPDLDLLNTLLATTKEQQIKAQPLIQVISEQSLSTEPPSDLAGEEFDWELPQALPDQESLTSTVDYGFNNQYRGWFTHVQEVGNEINSLSSPETLDESARHGERVEAEEDKFDPDYYISEWMENEEIPAILAHKTPWRKCYQGIRRHVQSAATQSEDISRPPTSATVQPVESTPTNTSTNGSSTTVATSSKVSLSVDNLPSFLSSFSDKEKALMQSLPAREYLVDSAMEKRLYLGLVDLMFVYNYNHRTTYGDSTIESVWTIGKLSPMLSCLVLFPTLKELIMALYRRSLAYPLYRHWELCKKVQQDTFVLLSLGRRGVLKALLELKDLFDHHDVYYVYSKIWLDDYCRWIQTSVNEKVLQSLAQQVNRLSLTKTDVGLSLEEWETVALAENSESESEAEDSTGDDDDSTESDGSVVESENDTDSQEVPSDTNNMESSKQNEVAFEPTSLTETDRSSSTRRALISIISDEPDSTPTSNIDPQEAESSKERISTTTTSSTLLDEHVNTVTSSLKIITLENSGSSPKPRT